MIEIRNVFKSFGSQQILSDISFSISSGDKLCIIGESGSGKSVLLKLITGLLKADRGEILFGGKSVRSFSSRDWEQTLSSVGVVFQGAALFDSLTVLENVGIRLFEERKENVKVITEKVAEALGRVGLNPVEVMNKFPSELSGGMQKRVGIARAIVHLPLYVFYDEPTTGLDPMNSDKVDGLILELASEKNRTSVIITHDIATVKRIASKVVMIHNRQVHFSGSADALFGSSDSIISRFLERSFAMKGKS